MDTEFNTLQVKLKDSVCTIIFDRPKKLNMFNTALRNELKRAFHLVEDESVRVLVLRGKGKAFSTGFEIPEFRDLSPHELSSFIGDFFALPYKCDFPTIAAIDGFALGGGLELSLACDLRVATERSQLGQPEIGIGLIPGGGGTQRLARLIGPHRAKELIMTGKRISGSKAAEWGVVNKVVPEDELDQAVEGITQQLVDGPPIALKLAKQVIDRGVELPLERGIQLEQDAFAKLLATEDVSEGIRAFSDKRDPDFKGK